MARGYVVNGECLVLVKGMVGTEIEEITELGLAEKGIIITPKYVHKDIRVDDFGPEVPADVLAMIAECSIAMTLVNFDPYILDACLSESMGGGVAGTMAGAGIPLGGGIPLYEEDCHYITLSLTSPNEEFDFGLPAWNFLATYMPVKPMEYPIGTEKTLARLLWRAIPYVEPTSDGEILSAGAVIWNRDAIDLGTD